MEIKRQRFLGVLFSLALVVVLMTGMSMTVSASLHTDGSGMGTSTSLSAASDTTVWYIGDTIDLDTKFFFDNDSNPYHIARGAGNSQNVPSPYYDNNLNMWRFNECIPSLAGITQFDIIYVDIILSPPSGISKEVSPIGFKVKSGDGSSANGSDPYRFELVYSNVNISPSAAQTTNVGGTVCLTAIFNTNYGSDRIVKWSVGGTDSGAVKLYSDANCTNEVQTDEETTTLTVYAKGLSLGSADVTVTNCNDETQTSTCTVTVTNEENQKHSGTQSGTQSGAQSGTQSGTQEKISITKTPKIIRAKAQKGKVTVNWKKIKNTKKTKALRKQIKSIQVQYSTDPTFTKDVVSKNVGKKKTTAKLKLQRKTVYYIRIRYVAKDGGFSNWSKVKKVRTK